MCALKVLPVEMIREADLYTINHEPVSSFDLMERAAGACYRWIAEKAEKSSLIRVICGMGNNGGDGLAIARMLCNHGYETDVLIIRHSEHPSADFLENLRLLGEQPGIVITDVFENDSEPEIGEEDIVIDALLGSGLNKPASGFVAGIIDTINQSGALVISVDMPSGLFADKPADHKKNVIVRADYTLTFQMPKLALLMAENEQYTGKWVVLDIGLHEDFLNSAACNNFYIQKEDCKSLYRPRPVFAHKGHFGHALLLAGSTGKLGAAVLASEACLRAGAGLLTTHIPGDGFHVMQNSVHEAMVSIDPADDCITTLPVLDVYSAIGAGPGLGMHETTQAVIKLLIQETRVPLVLDADALNILGENKTWISFLPPGSILTPHPKEFERLAGPTANHFDRLELQRVFAIRYKVFVILKGAFTSVACPDGNVYFNSSGNPGMASGGSGDVLTGIILGLLASGYPARDACILGTWLHGKAGDIAAKKSGHEALLARDILSNIGKAFRKIY